MAKSKERQRLDCSVCRHPDADQFNEMILKYGGRTKVARILHNEHGELTESAWQQRVSRHVEQHIPDSVEMVLAEGRGSEVDLQRGQRILAGLDYALAMSLEVLTRTNDWAKEMDGSDDWKDRTARAAAEGAVTKNLLAVAKIAETLAGVDERGQAVSRQHLTIEMPSLQNFMDELNEVRKRQFNGVKAGLIELPESDFSDLEDIEAIEDAQLIEDEKVAV